MLKGKTECGSSEDHITNSPTPPLVLRRAAKNKTMMKKPFFLFLLMLGAVGSYAQKMMFLTGKSDHLLMKPAVIEDSTQIDRCELTVRYRFTKTDTPGSGKTVWTDILMQVGDRYVKQTDMCLRFDHLILTTGKIGGELSRRRSLAGIRPSNLFSEMICDLRNREMDVLCGDYFNDNAMKTYTQEIPALSWQPTEGRKTILGYTCGKAVADFAGRQWTAWYTTEIPLAYGPWKLGGLPGLVLSATDGRDFTFDCMEITENHDPIIRYRYASSQELKSLQNYLRYERSCFEHPLETFANGEQAMVFLREADGKTVQLDGSWTIPYDPIEWPRKNDAADAVTR